MVDRTLTDAPAAPAATSAVARLVAPWWRVHWVLRVLLVFALSRAVTTAVLVSFAARQPLNAWTGPSPDYLDFASIWDGHWYRIIAVVGYPDELPRTDDGEVAQNAWAFMPVYPLLIRGVMALTGAPYELVAVAISVLAAAGAALLFHRLMTLVLPDDAGKRGAVEFAVVLFCVAPLSPIMQVAYAESLHLFLLTAMLVLLVQRRYWALVPVIAVASLTRPSGLAFALALGLHVIVRFVQRGSDPFPVRERVLAAAVAVWSGLCGLAWLLICAAVTGDLAAYTDTELAWRAAYIGYQHLVPLTPWLLAGDWWTVWWFGSAFGWVLVAMVIAAAAALLFLPSTRRLGVDLRLWVASYFLYLLAVFFPQSSTFRLLVPAFPLLGAFAQTQRWWVRVLLVLACVAGQVWWIDQTWWVVGADWTPP